MKIKRKQKIILASASPRRRDLLKYFFDLVLQPPVIDETPIRGESPKAYVLRIAKAKWTAVARKQRFNEKRILVSADTTVALRKRILGKPESANDCRRMMLLLSGKTHQVYSAVCCGKVDSTPRALVVRSDVEFREIKSKELSRYLRAGDWHGKAGGYAIQGDGAQFVESIQGPMTNIVGLPIHQTLRLIDRFT